jgi:sialic acid synthase SpsE
MHIAMRPLTTQKVTSTGTSTQSSAFSDNIEYIRIIPDADCHIEFGTSPTATTSKIFLESKNYEYFKISSGEKVAVIGSVNLYITELSE